MVQRNRRQIIIDPLTLSQKEILSLASELREYCEDMQLPLSHDDSVLCVQHLLMVKQVNSYMNLTRIQDLQDALILHVIDSLSLTRILPFNPERFLDIGTGAGFPGIPFSISTKCHGVLLDSVGKKINAVNAFIHELGLQGVQGVHERCESYALTHMDCFDIVLARAVGQMNLLIELAAPVLEKGGYLILAKANPSQDEYLQASKTADICGLEQVGVDEFELPLQKGHRTVYLYQKVDEPKIKLPRAIGLAKKQPLV